MLKWRHPNGALCALRPSSRYKSNKTLNKPISGRDKCRDGHLMALWSIPRANLPADECLLKLLWFSFLSLGQFVLLTWLWFLFLGQTTAWIHSYLPYNSCSWLLAKTKVVVLSTIPLGFFTVILGQILFYFLFLSEESISCLKIANQHKVLWDNARMTSSSEYFRFISFGGEEGRGGNCWSKGADTCCSCMLNSKKWDFSAQGSFLPGDGAFWHTCKQHFTASAEQPLLKNFVLLRGSLCVTRNAFLIKRSDDQSTVTSNHICYQFFLW